MIRTATNNNRVNTQGLVRPDMTGRTSHVLTLVVPAGATLPYPVAGSEFYVVVATGPLHIRPSGQTFNLYTEGQGLECHNAPFQELEIRNETAEAITCRIFIGFDGFIDKRLVISNTETPQVAYPTYSDPTGAPETEVEITDKSGHEFLDINGEKWFALERVAILIFNESSTDSYRVQATSASDADGPSIATVFPQTGIRLDISGDYVINNGATDIEAVVTEIYKAISNPN